MYVYIYIYRERERERSIDRAFWGAAAPDGRGRSKRIPQRKQQ